MNNLIGKTIGKYTVGSLIATGGMGEIYAATREGEEDVVVMKVALGRLQGNIDIRKRFLREIRLLLSLDHPHIIPILDWGYEKKVLYYIMKKINGPTLTERIDAESLTPAKSRDILLPLAQALDYMHGEGVMHRDIKPGNVLLEREDGGWHVYLTDFGLGKNPERDKLLPMVSRTMGTVEFMSPEAVSEADVDYRTDIYSLTALAYEMLLGKKPQTIKRGEDGNAVEHVLLLPSLINAEFPYPLEAVLLQGMEYDRKRRFKSAGAFIKAYDEALAQLTEEQQETPYQTFFKQKSQLLS
jgi:serine/threonine-protein kinase